MGTWGGGISPGKTDLSDEFWRFFTKQKGDFNRFHKQNFEDLTNEIWDVSHKKLWIFLCIPVAKRRTWAIRTWDFPSKNWVVRCCKNDFMGAFLGVVDGCWEFKFQLFFVCADHLDLDGACVKSRCVTLQYALSPTANETAENSK